MMLHVFTFQDIGSTESEAHHAEIEKLEERASALRKVLACKWSSKFSLCCYIPIEVGLLHWSYLIYQNLFSYGGSRFIPTNIHVCYFTKFLFLLFALQPMPSFYDMFHHHQHVVICAKFVSTEHGNTEFSFFPVYGSVKKLCQCLRCILHHLHGLFYWGSCLF